MEYTKSAAASGPIMADLAAHADISVTTVDRVPNNGSPCARLPP